MADKNRFSIGSPVSVISSENPLTLLLHRLEAATSRLEDIASSAFEPSAGNASSIPASGASAAAMKASSSEPTLPGITPTSSQQTVRAVPEDLPASISHMDDLIEKEVKAFTDASKGIDPLVEEQAAAVAKAFADQRQYLLITTKAKRPDPQGPTFMALLKDLQQDLGTAGDIKDSNRGSPMKEHLSMVAEGISTLQWLIMDGKPADVVAEMIGGAQMYGNRVLKAHKEGCAWLVTRAWTFADMTAEIKHMSNLCDPTMPSSKLSNHTSRSTTHKVSPGTLAARTYQKR